MALYTWKRFPAFLYCIHVYQVNGLVVLNSLENSKQCKNVGKRFRVYGAYIVCMRLFMTCRI